MSKMPPQDCAFLSPEEMEAVFARLDCELDDWRQIEVVGPRGVGKTYFSAAYAGRIGCAIGNRALSNRLMRPHLTWAERIGRVFLPRRMRTQIRRRVVMRAHLKLRPEEQVFLKRLLAVLQTALTLDLDPERRATLEYCAGETPAAVLREAYLHREHKKALLDEGVLKLLLGFLRWHPGPLSDEMIEEIRACLADYPGERHALFLAAPASVVDARRTWRGDPAKSEPPYTPSFELLHSLCEQSGWKILRIEAWSRGRIPVTCRSDEGVRP